MIKINDKKFFSSFIIPILIKKLKAYFFNQLIKLYSQMIKIITINYIEIY